MLDHIEIYVSDMVSSRRFYDFLLPKLGYVLYQDWEAGFSYRKEGNYLVFVQVGKRYADAPYHRCQVGLNHLAFQLNSWQDLEKLKQDLLERGIPLLYEDRYPWAGGDDAYRLYCEDSDRIKLEFIAQKPVPVNLPRLETDRLYLRQVALSDAPDLYAYGQKSEVAQLAGFPVNQSLEEVETFIQQNLKMTVRDRAQAIFVLEHQASHQVIGTIHFNKRLDRHILSMGYVLHPDYWGQGLMFEAGQAFLEWGFTALGLHKVTLTIHAYNQASQALARRLGFSQEGRLRDHKRLGMIYYDTLLYGLLREEWQKKTGKNEKTLY